MAIDYISRGGLTTTLPRIKQAHSALPQNVYIEKNLVVSVSSISIRKARVLHPFYIQVEQLEKEYVASSEISDVFESGDTFKEATLSYLHSLVDEFIWLEDHKDSLSNHILKDLKKLQFHLVLL